ncbi:MAG: hypothetical protein JWO37_2573 [Acidimicrobiales bacterium]|jgi:hypothetical protein|nr:hypothetical protein [Acidimicrobiales bacterium]
MEPADLDVTEIERELCRLPEVNAARIVIDEIGRPTEIHILATSGKHAKQVARDIQSVAMATFGLELDRRIISVVQLDGGQRDETVIGTPMRGGRVIVGTITSEQSGLRQVIRVALEREDDKSEGVAEGSVASSSRHRLVAQATLEALRQIVPVADCADIEMAIVQRVGTRDVAVACVVFVVPPHEEIVSGSAVVRLNNEPDAVARAVLDATNRRLVQLAT